MYICTLVGVVCVTDDLERLVAEIPSELKALVDADRRTNKEVVEAALWSEFGGRKKSALEAKKDNKLQQLEAIEASIESEKEDKERVLNEVESIEAQIEKMEGQQQAKIAEAKDALQGTPKEPDNPAIKNWASDLGMTPQALIEELEGDDDE